ncbi:MAG: metalloregulator ArsR/SmtB family transcription factor [Chloroflexota bacterium]
MDKNLINEVNRLHAEICGGLSDPKRILILYALSVKPTNVTDLSLDLDTPQPTISRNLKVLKSHNLVSAKRDGKHVVYQITDIRIIQALDLLRGLLTDNLKKQAVLIQSIKTESLGIKESIK